ncbi:ABC transporter permease [Austwickia chelonae]|uniref:ABC transporter permease n=1 Tax=Austwickia chelonae TaxID=100225 RepID=UPI000E23FC74|nr:FtsX-like permease family protein [Austwickia chelonae]
MTRVKRGDGQRLPGTTAFPEARRGFGFTRPWRVAVLAIALARRSIGRTVTMVVMLALALVLFMVTSALAKASSHDLNAAVRGVDGPPGLVYLDLPQVPSQSRSVSAQLAAEALARSATHLNYLVVESLPGLKPSCVGQQEKKAPGKGGQGSTTRAYAGILAMQLSSGPEASSDDRRESASGELGAGKGSRGPNGELHGSGCFGDIPVPAEAFQTPPPALSFLQPGSIVVAQPYLPLAQAELPVEENKSASTRIMVWSMKPETSLKEVLAGICRESTAAGRAIDGLPDDVCVVQQPPDHADLRRASAGVESLYRLLGASVLCLGAVGVLVAENIIVRDRRWLFGLARAYGARGADIALLVVLDVVIVLCGAALVAAGTVAIWQPFLEEWSQSALNTQITLYQPADLGYLALGCAGVLLIAGVGPAMKAVRNDPLDILEGRG